MKKSLLAALAAALLAVSPVNSAKAEMSKLEIMFVKGDQNGDLVLNKAEVLLIVVNRFNHADSDRDNKLEKQEVGDLANDPEFTDNDTDKDGALSIEEVIAEKMADFKTADKDSNGSLTITEVKEFYDKKNK